MRAILIDTVAAACGAREQTPALQGELRDIGNRIAAETGAIVCWIQHEGKSANGPIGYLDLANSCSTWWQVEEREDGSRVVHVQKANRGPSHMPLFAFRLVPFTAGQDDKGKDIVLCDIEEVGLEGALASPTRQRFGKLQNNNTPKPGGKLQKIMAKALAQLARKHPEGVEKALLKSAFIRDYVAAEHAAGRPTPEGGGAPDMSTQIEFGTFATDPPRSGMTGHFDTVLAIRKASDVTLKEGRELRRLLIAELRKLRFNVEAFDSDLALAKAMVARFPSQESMRMLNVLQAEMACTGARA